MKKFLLPLTIILLSCSPKEDCNEKINLLPMYGKVKKCDKQIQTDNKFFAFCDKEFKNRKEAAKIYVNLGWAYLNNGILDTAMFRFNQAWLLDSALIDVNWGFGAVLGAQQQYEQAIYYLKRYQTANPNNDRIYIDMATTYFQYASFQNQKGLNDSWISNLNIGKFCIKKSLEINDKNAYAYRQLAIAYYNENKIDSSKYYGQIANKLDPKVLHPDFKKAVGIN